MARPDQSTATTHLPDRLAQGVTLVVGYRPEGFGAWIIDAGGSVLHRWDATFSQIFGSAASQLQYQARDITIAWHGTHLYPNGDILFNFQDNSFPVRQRAGEARQGRQGDLEAGPEHPPCGYRGGRRYDLGPCAPLSRDGVAGMRGLKPWYYEDEVLKVSPDGKVLDEISILGAFAQRPGAFGVTYGSTTEVAQTDPTHLNDVEPLPAALAAQFPQFERGRPARLAAQHEHDRGHRPRSRSS